MLRKSYTFLHRSLVYIDVDDISSKHRQMVIDDAISEVPKECERAETVAVRHQLVEALSKQWKWKPHLDGYAYCKNRVSSMVGEVYHGGMLARQMMQYLLSIQSPHE